MPPLPSEPIEALDRLLADPARWAELDPEKLRHLLFYQCLSYGIEPDEQRIPALMDLHRVAVERLHPAVRREVVVHLARAVERIQREHAVTEGAGCTNALLPFLLEDPDPSVVSSAAAEMATLLPLEQGDELTGPRYVRSLLDDVRGDDPRAGIVAGLLQLGDPRLAPLVAGAWKGLGEEGRQTLALLIQGFHGVHTLTVDFLTSWLEDESTQPEAPAFGVVAATLARAGRHAADHGVTRVRRTFPLVDAPDREPCATSEMVTADEYASSLFERLSSAAAAEDPPRLMPHVLSYWGFDAAAYRLATKAAVVSAGATRDQATGLCVPAPLDLVPEWPEEPEAETLIEWGIFNPMGPSVNTLRLTPTGAAVALVYTMYHPAGTVSHVMATWDRPPDAETVASAVVHVLSRNGYGGLWLVRSVPDYVYLPAGSVMERSGVASGLEAARRAVVEAGESSMDLVAHAERLRRLAIEPWTMVHEEMEREPCGAAAERAGAGRGGEGREDFLAWLLVAASPAHVSIVRAQIPVAWQRLQSPPDPGDAPGGQVE